MRPCHLIILAVISSACLSSPLILSAEMGPAPVNASKVLKKPIYLDPTAPLEDRIKDLMGRLTLEQKAQLLNHKGPTVTLDGFSIRADQWNQCLNGVQWDRPTTLFPVCVGLAATWNPELIERDVAAVLSDEARAIYNGWHLDPNAPGEHKGLIYRAPVINIERNPYWGRNHEAWGEDPFLTGRMAVAYVKGLQGSDPGHLKIAATLKHFAVNNVEGDRTKLNASVSERMLREYWLPHWHDAVVEGKASSLMASYNAINGTPNNINHWLLTDLLKNEWHHQGFVVSDLGGVKTMVEGHEKGRMNYVDAVSRSLMAGCDFSDKEFQENIPAAVQTGKLTEERLNDALARVLRIRFRLGEFDPFETNPYSKISISVVNSLAHRAIALKVAQESIVLLQNRDALLPLDRSKIRSIAVLGPLADRVNKNSYNGVLPDSVTLLQGIKDRAARGTQIFYGVGGVVGGNSNSWVKSSIEPRIDEAAELSKAVKLASQSDIAIVCVGTTAAIEQEGRDRTSLGLPGNQEQLIKAVLAANPRTIVVEMSAGPLTVPFIKDHLSAVLQAWWPGEEGGHAIADVLFGDYNPAGRLPHTVYASENQVPPIDEYDITKGFTYMYLKGSPLYVFGHGLSYTRFDYSGLSLTPNVLNPSGILHVEFSVTNAGVRDGEEVTQLYIQPPKTSVPMPAKELRGFLRFPLKAGEKRRLTFDIPADKLAYWNENIHAFEVPAGDYKLLVGSSSEMIQLTGTFQITKP